MLVEVGSDQPLNKIDEAVSLTDALNRAESHCKNCKTSSPMVCIERCDVWRMKHEILEIRRVTGENTHMRQLLNALKNKRRLRILGTLCGHSSNVEEMQRHLRENGLHHSRNTIVENYIKPLIRVGLVREDGVMFKVTFYGRKIHDLLSELGSVHLLPTHSCCYEEVVLRELNSPKTFNELTNRVPSRSLSRVLMRLRAKRLLAERANSHHVFYHKAKGRPRMRLSPTEKRVFDAIPQIGIQVHSLSIIVGINLRRTYKYLRKLREKKLVFALKTKRTYELTAQGREILKIIDQIEKLAASSLNMPVPVPQQIS
jgi:predicted transcriptional regulator